MRCPCTRCRPLTVPPATYKNSNAASYVSLVTVHWYKATKETHNTPASLLDEGPIGVEMDNLKQLVQVANGFGKPLRCVWEPVSVFVWGVHVITWGMLLSHLNGVEPMRLLHTCAASPLCLL
jgi:hypothetical protein